MEQSFNNTTSTDLKYKGVRKRKWGKWVSEIRLPNSRERIWLGSYDTPEKAARAFDAALYCLRGPQAKFNFPENPPEIEGGRSMSPQQIQLVASRFANEEPQPPVHHHHHQDGTDGGDNSSRANIETSSSSVSDGTIGQVESDMNNVFYETCDVNHIDWSYWNMLDSGVTACDFGFVPPPPEPTIFDNGDDDDITPEDDFSNQSFLWNF